MAAPGFAGVMTGVAAAIGEALGPVEGGMANMAPNVAISSTTTNPIDISSWRRAGR